MNWRDQHRLKRMLDTCDKLGIEVMRERGQPTTYRMRVGNQAPHMAIGRAQAETWLAGHISGRLVEVDRFVELAEDERVVLGGSDA